MNSTSDVQRGSVDLLPSSSFSTPTRALENKGAPFVLAAAHALIWACLAILLAEGSLHQDMLEAYTWGKEFQLGYYKHPPFWAWISGIWFEIFPRTDFSFLLLSSTVEAAGLLGIFAIAGFFLNRRYAVLAMLIAMCSPFYGNLGMVFNANSIFIAILPWSTYFYLRMLKHGAIADSVAFGLLCAFGFLSKYFMVFMLFAYCIAPLLHRSYRSIFARPGPYVAIATFLVCILPHMLWAVAHGFPTLTYAKHVVLPTHWSYLIALLWTLGGIAGIAALQSIPTTIVLHQNVWKSCLIADARNALPFLLSLLLLPLCASLAVSAVLLAKVSLKMFIGYLYLLPVIIAICIAGKFDRAARVYGAYLCLYLGGAAGFAVLRPVHDFIRPQRADSSIMKPLVAFANDFWQDASDKPLNFVGGSMPASSALVFYSKRNLSDFIDLSGAHAPWIIDSDIMSKGFLVLCREDDSGCIDKKEKLEKIALRSVTKNAVFTDRLRNVAIRYELSAINP